MIKRTPHLINGKRLGTFYAMPDGSTLYMLFASGEKSRALCLKTNAWCISTFILREVERRDCKAVGVSHRIGKAFTHYVTNIEEFWGVKSTSRTFAGQTQRCLKRGLFLVNSSNWEGSIEKRMRIR